MLVCSIRFGARALIKLFEAAAKCHIVSTALGAEEVGVTECLIYDLSEDP